MEILKGRIVDIEKRQNRITYLKQGVKEPDQYKYRNNNGGHGTYVTGGEYLGTSLNVKIFVYALGKSYNFDVYEDILRITEKSRISSKILNTIESHQGEKINIFVDEQKVAFDPNILLQ